MRPEGQSDKGHRDGGAESGNGEQGTGNGTRQQARGTAAGWCGGNRTEPETRQRRGRESPTRGSKTAGRHAGLPLRGTHSAALS